MKRELSKQNTLCLVVKYIWFSYSRKLHLGTHLQSIIYVRHFLILFWLFVQVFWTFFKISLIKLSWRVKRRLSLHGMFYTLFKSFQQWNVAKVHYDGFSRINHICEYKHRTIVRYSCEIYRLMSVLLDITSTIQYWMSANLLY